MATSLAALLVWLGPPGNDLAAHAYQRAFFLRHGFVLWNNFWYAGRYSFVTYSPLYYPLSAVLGIRVLALASITTAAAAFAIVVGRQWGPAARWSGRTFAVVWAGTVLSAAFPFALGAALGLLAPRPELATLLGQLGMSAALLLGVLPADRMPEVVRFARDLLPSTYGVEAFARTFGRHPDWAFVLGDLAVCGAVGVVSLAVATWAYRRAAVR
jgi:hypothetical protein